MSVETVNLEHTANLVTEDIVESASVDYKPKYEHVPDLARRDMDPAGLVDPRVESLVDSV